MKKLMLLKFLLVNVLIANAQFVLPVIPDSSYGVTSVYSRRTGSDIYQINDSAIYRVSVWEQDSASHGFGYVVDYNGTRYQGTLPFYCTDHVINADVCLLKNAGNTITAAVVYNDYNNNNYFLEYFEWKTSPIGFYSINVDTIFSGTTGTTLNIDGNSSNDGEFTIVWDDNNQIIYEVVGSIANGVVTQNNIALGISPDVSMYYNGTEDIVHVVYIDSNNQELTVNDYKYSDLLLSNTIPINSQSIAPNTNSSWSFPRIASPGPNSGNGRSWTVITLESDTNNCNVTGFNNNFVTRIPYNFNSPPTQLIGVPNYDLSVCYTDQYPNNGIYVGWAFVSDTTKLSTPYYNILKNTNYSIVLRCDNSGTKLDTAYWQVSSSLTNNNYDYSSFLSMAARHGSDELFATYQNIVINGSNLYDINYKQIVPISSANSFKLSNEITNSNKKLVKISCYDVQGKLLFVKMVNDFEKNELMVSKEISNQIIIIKFEYNDNSFVTNKYFTTDLNTINIK